MPAKNQVTTANGYTSENTLVFPAAIGVTLIVSNAAIYYQLNLNYTGVRATPGGGNWVEEKQLLPGFWRFAADDFNGGTCTGIRVRSAVAGTPAIISMFD